MKKNFLSSGGLLGATSAIIEAFEDFLSSYSTEVFQSGLSVAELILPTDDSKENINKATKKVQSYPKKMKIVIIIARRGQRILS